MRIGEVAARSGLTTATIRFYERSGVLPGPGRQTNGYRHYSAADLDRATTFARLRALDIDPREAGRLADQCASGDCDATWAELGGLLATHREAIGARIAELQGLDARLAALQGSLTTAGQSDHLTASERKENTMLDCTCDGGCCGGPNGPCC